jgi:serine phosphatase RsbU (regulator of sigma subunit)
VTGDGVYRGRAWYYRDVTDLKRAQEERSRLYEAERLAHLEAETSRSRLQFLLEASTLLAGSVEVDDALSSLAGLVARSLADYCAVDLVGPTGAVRRAASARRPGIRGPVEAGGDPEAEGAAREQRNDSAVAVIRSRRSLLVPDARRSPVPIRGGPGVPRIGSYIAVPLLARNQALGSLSLALGSRARRQYGPDDLALAQDLGRRIALALDHARLFNVQRHIAMTLQERLLPPELPVIPGVQLAARYRAASAVSEVGGDFYDVFPTGEAAWAITLGDISGKGVEAASLTALARYTVRAAAREHRQPREILFQLNEAVMEERPSSRFLTIVFGRLRWRPGGLRLTVACGGHPPPLLLRAEGGVERAARPGTLIGFLPSPDLPEKVSDLRLGDVVLFFTDGLTDVRGPSGTFGEERLVALLRACRGLEAEEIAARLEGEVLAFQAGQPRDDLALVVLRVVGRGP